MRCGRSPTFGWSWCCRWCPTAKALLAEVPQLYGRSLAMRTIIEAGGDRVAVFGLTTRAGMPIYVHSKTCVIDHRWASVGSDNLNRRSWTSDSEIACTVVDERGDLDDPAPEDSFPRVLLRTLVAEHLGCEPDDVPEDPHELFDAMVACADALDEWYAGGAPRPADRHPRAGRPAGCRAASLPVPQSVSAPSPGHRSAAGEQRPERAAAVERGSPRRPAAARPAASAGGTGADRRPAPVGAAAVRPAVRPRRSATSRRGELTMAKRRDIGAWSKDPRDALRAGPDFDLDEMDRGGDSRAGSDDKKAAKKLRRRSAATCSASCRSGSSPRAGPAETERCW